jgi:hypothetical protein
VIFTSNDAFLCGPNISHAWFVLLLALHSTIERHSSNRWTAATSLLILAFRDSFTLYQKEFCAAATDAIVLEMNRIRADMLTFTAREPDFEVGRQSYWHFDYFESLVDQLFTENKFVVKTTPMFQKVEEMYKVLKGPFRNKLIHMYNLTVTKRDAARTRDDLVFQVKLVEAMEQQKIHATQAHPWTREHEEKYQKETQKRDEDQESLDELEDNIIDYRHIFAHSFLPP